MDENERTIFCGNLSSKVTEDIFYELFLQAGPIEKVSIPKDRDGKPRTYGFVTYKHVNSVKYALNLFEDTTLYNRTLTMKPRYNAEAQEIVNTADHCGNNMMQQLQLLQQNQPIALSGFPLLNMNPSDDKNLKRMHPYQRDKHRERDKIRDRDRDRNRDRDRDRDKERNKIYNYDYYKERDEKQFKDYPHDYSRYNANRKRWSYH